MRGIRTEATELPLPLPLPVAGGLVRFATTTPTRDLAPLLGWAAERAVELDGLTVSRPSLEDVYVELTKETPA